MTCLTLQPREYQIEAVSSLYWYFENYPEGNPVIAMPTGTGKSIVIALFLQSVYQQWPGQKILVLTHVKELIQQNYDELVGLWPQAPAGIYSSGLNRRDTRNAIVFAGIASVAKRADEFGRVDLLLIDEAHLVSPTETTMYRKFIAQLMVTNPMLRVIGLTATPWRLGHGKITEGEQALFSDICFDITGINAFNRLIAEGFLASLVPKPTQTVLNIDGVGMRGGEFIQGEMQRAVDIDSITEMALREAMEYGHNRQSWLIFCAGVEHACNTARILNDLGVPCGVVHSDMSPEERKQTFDDFKSGKLRALANNNIATTGFNHPPVDLIIMLRPTASAVLWVQMLGRGTRPYDPRRPGRVDPIAFPLYKRNCLVLDFAGNTKRLGPVNDPVVPNKKGKKGGKAPVKLCEKCNTMVHASLVWCNIELDDGTICNNEFPREVKLMVEAGTDQLVKGDNPVVEVFKVDHITYTTHTKSDRPDSIKVSYYCGMQSFNEYVCCEHTDYAGKKARRWWRERSTEPMPEDTQTAMEVLQQGQMMAATHLRVWLNKKYPEILAFCYDGSAFGTQVPSTDDNPTQEVVGPRSPHIPNVNPDFVAGGQPDFDAFDDDIPF